MRPDIVMLYYLIYNQFIHVLRWYIFQYVWLSWQIDQISKVVICVKLFYSMSSCFCSIWIINDEEDMDLPLISSHHYENISFCYFHKQILPEHGKTCPSCTNLENFDKGKVTTRKSLHWNHAVFWIFIQNIIF